VRILAAPDDGRGAFTTAAITRTRGNGAWTARIGPGPSRLIKAVYGGGDTVEPTSSVLARLVVPASLQLNISPHRTHWGGTIDISGRLRGGYIPPSGKVVVLRIGWRGGWTEIGHLYARRNGTFHSTYTFLRGNGTETYHLWAVTTHETDYPYAPGRSHATYVTVGP
jgi:hypothetical protein